MELPVFGASRAEDPPRAERGRGGRSRKLNCRGAARPVPPQDRRGPSVGRTKDRASVPPPDDRYTPRLDVPLSPVRRTRRSAVRLYPAGVGRARCPVPSATPDGEVGGPTSSYPRESREDHSGPSTFSWLPEESGGVPPRSGASPPWSRGDSVADDEGGGGTRPPTGATGEAVFSASAG